jgi:hypothetical protein
MKVRLIIAAVIFGVLALSCGCFGIIAVVYWAKVKSEIAPFEAHIAEYTRTPDPLEGDADAGYIKGKVIPIDRGKDEIDAQFWTHLPTTLKPEKPEEVGTIVWLEWDKEEAGEYEGGGTAYIQTCDVTVIDKARNIIVGQAHFEGEEKKEIAKRAKEGTGEKPYSKIVSYLNKLPRK